MVDPEKHRGNRRVVACYDSSIVFALIVALAVLVGAGAAQAQQSGKMPKQFDDVGLDDRLGNKLPLDLRFKNSDGETVKLGQYFGQDKPVYLTLVYHNCPMLCGLMLKRVTRTMKKMKWTPGDEYEAVTVSFNHRETPDIASRQKKKYLKVLGKDNAATGWHFLTGSKENIGKLADAVGFNFRWVPKKKQYAHPAALFFVSEDGLLTRYLKDWAAPPGDVRKALVEASNGTVGTVVDQALMYCFQYDPSSNSYVADAFNLMKAGGILTMIVLGAMLFYFWRRERRELDATTAAAEKDWSDELSEA